MSIRLKATKKILPLLLTAFLGTAVHAAETPAGSNNKCAEMQQYIMGLKYQQQSAEIHALQLQSYELATLHIQQYLQQHPNAKNIAVVTDLDETVLDNSALLVRDTEQCHDWRTWDTWNDWEVNGHPTLMPGSLAFFNFLNERGIKIFYVSDRTQEHKASTVATLKELKLPQVSMNNVLLYDSPKQQRREKIAKDYNIIMLLGDSLPDFSSDFTSKQSKTEREQGVLKNQHHFGHDWIVLPNSSYGAWSKDTLKAWDEPLKK
ncbi:5'-nucleotidase, lipoprotein e(P4) family [Acinetobacter nectaris]|uniref:5'-nucleotidase, lipoprotein e(P4) family n=1 Tax=Acinetobacter nectaris TaxID=1219382 RepID=UPI001F0154E9|nr:5'-nucleotidase, lipoprotein e(P4) family [Acinetobacter nectaris]